MQPLVVAAKHDPHAAARHSLAHDVAIQQALTRQPQDVRLLFRGRASHLLVSRSRGPPIRVKRRHGTQRTHIGASVQLRYRGSPTVHPWVDTLRSRVTNRGSASGVRMAVRRPAKAVTGRHRASNGDCRAVSTNPRQRPVQVGSRAPGRSAANLGRDRRQTAYHRAGGDPRGGAGGGDGARVVRGADRLRAGRVSVHLRRRVWRRAVHGGGLLRVPRRHLRVGPTLRGPGRRGAGRNLRSTGRERHGGHRWPTERHGRRIQRRRQRGDRRGRRWHHRRREHVGRRRRRRLGELGRHLRLRDLVGSRVFVPTRACGPGAGQRPDDRGLSSHGVARGRRARGPSGGRSRRRSRAHRGLRARRPRDRARSRRQRGRDLVPGAERRTGGHRDVAVLRRLVGGGRLRSRGGLGRHLRRGLALHRERGLDGLRAHPGSGERRVVCRGAHRPGVGVRRGR